MYSGPLRFIAFVPSSETFSANNPALSRLSLAHSSSMLSHRSVSGGLAHSNQINQQPDAKREKEKRRLQRRKQKESGDEEGGELQGMRCRVCFHGIAAR